MKGMGAGLWSFLRAVGTPGVSNGAGQALVVGNRAWAPSLQPVGVGRALAGPWVLGGWFCLGPCMSLAYSVHWGRPRWVVADGWLSGEKGARQAPSASFYKLASKKGKSDFPK